MSFLIDRGVVSIVDCGTNFAYILNDSSHFLSTEYKVLQSQTSNCFISCMKMMYNGKLELYYNVKTYKPLSVLLPQLSPEGLLTIIGNIFAGVIDIKNNGFLSCRNIDGFFEHIYVDPSNYKIGLVYLPLNVHEFQDDASFENALRARLVQIITSLPNVSSPEMLQFCSDLQNGKMTVEDIYSNLGKKRRRGTNGQGGGLNGGRGEHVPRPYGSGSGDFRLIAMDAPSKFEIVIDKPEFTIGKRATNDGIITFNNMISRTHCKIINKNGVLYVQDLQSANGTYVNGVKLQAGQNFPIKNGDIIRLADSNFQLAK